MRGTTTRGILGEMLLPFAKWPMRSPWRLGAVLIAVLTVLILIGRVGGDSFPAAGPASRPTVAATTSPPVTTSPAAATPASPDPATAAEVSTVAEDFVRAWAHPVWTTDAWMRAVNRQPLTESYAQSLGSTDPHTIPASEVKGTPKVVNATSSDAQVQVSTDGPTVLVVLTRESGRWVVANLRPSTEDDP